MSFILSDQQFEELRVCVEAFASPSARRRYLALLSTKRGRELVASRLDHVSWFDDGFVHEVPSPEQTPEHILPMLVRLGAPSSCSIISTNASLNGRRMPLRDALDEVVSSGCGTFLICVPGRLAYYESESPLGRYVCFRGAR